MKIELTDKNLKKFFFIPIVLFAIAIVILLISYSQTGQFLKKGIDLEGGIQITVRLTDEISITDFEAALQPSFPDSEISVVTTTDPSTRKQSSVVISVSGSPEQEKVVSEISNYLNMDLKPTEYSIASLGPALATSFWRQARWAFAFAFILMMMVVGFTYKSMAPSFAIIISAAYDLLIIMGAMSLLEIHLTLATFAALLMIIGYSVDTNILLTDKIIKQREGTVFERINIGLKTGLTMSAATIATFLAIIFFTNSIILQEIALILLIGSVADIPNTWLLNANLLLRWPKKSRE